MGEPVFARQLHSVQTAANETGIDTRRLPPMLEAAGLIKSTEAKNSDGWEVFDAAKAEQLLKDLAELVPANTFTARLGASRSQFDLLVADDVFLPALVNSTTKSIWNLQDVHVLGTAS